MEPQRWPEPQQSDYPDVKFWYKHEWTSHMKKDKGITHAGMDAGQPKDDGEDDDRDEEPEDQANDQMKSKAMSFITNEKGIVIENWRVSIIQNAASNCWMDILEHKDMEAPQKWRQIKQDAKRYYYNRMMESCPEVGLAANNWKAEEIATHYYPNFTKKHVIAIAAQWTTDSDQDGVLNLGKKCTHSPTRHMSTPRQKRPRQDLPVLQNPL